VHIAPSIEGYFIQAFTNDSKLNPKKMLRLFLSVGPRSQISNILGKDIMALTSS